MIPLHTAADGTMVCRTSNSDRHTIVERPPILRPPKAEGNILVGKGRPIVRLSDVTETFVDHMGRKNMHLGGVINAHSGPPQVQQSFNNNTSTVLNTDPNPSNSTSVNSTSSNVGNFPSTAGNFAQKGCNTQSIVLMVTQHTSPGVFYHPEQNKMSQCSVEVTDDSLVIDNYSRILHINIMFWMSVEKFKNNFAINTCQPILDKFEI